MPHSVTIKSLPAAFAMMKAMHPDGLEWGEDYRPFARKAVAEIIEGHIRYHIVDPDRQPTTEKARAAQQLIDVVKTYLK